MRGLGPVFFFQAEDGIRDIGVTGVQTCALPISDGAAAVLVMPGEAARAEGRQPLGYLRAYAYAGCDPRRMGLGPVFAVSKLLESTGRSEERRVGKEC